MRITRSKPYVWNPTRDKKLGTIMCKSAKNGETVHQGLVEASKKLGCTIAVVNNHWYGSVKNVIATQYARAQQLAGVKAQVRLNVEVVPTATEVKIPEVKQVEVIKSEEPKAIAATETPKAQVDQVFEQMNQAEEAQKPDTMQLLEELKGNTAVYTSLTFLIQRFAKMDADIVSLKRALKRKDIKIAEHEETVRAWNERKALQEQIRQGQR